MLLNKVSRWWMGVKEYFDLMRYAELQVTTHFPFLRGASSADELFAAAAVLGVEALGMVDRNSLRGIVGAWGASKAIGLS